MRRKQVSKYIYGDHIKSSAGCLSGTKVVPRMISSLDFSKGDFCLKNEEKIT